MSRHLTDVIRLIQSYLPAQIKKKKNISLICHNNYGIDSRVDPDKLENKLDCLVLAYIPPSSTLPFPSGDGKV